MEFRNEEKFTKWLKGVVKDGVDCGFDLWAYDIEKEVCNGYKSLEVKGYFTKTGNPVTYDFEVEHHYFLNGKEVEPQCDDYDYVKTIVIL